MVSSIRSVQPDNAGSVQISLDETRRRVVSGRLDDHNIQRLLMAAAREQDNPGVRVESVELLKDRGSSVAVRAVLLEAVTHDPNPGVRLKALEGLKSFAADAEVRKTLAQVLLKDQNAGVRIQAIDLLIANRDAATVSTLQTLIGKEDNNYIRLRCQNALRNMNASVGTF
jgi:HEAT repeat protein